MRNSKEPFRKNLSHLIAGVIILLNFVLIITAQDRTYRPERGVGGKGTQYGSEIDSVNLQNGNVSLNIPLASLPPIAGGKLSGSISAYYNSRLYNARSLEKQLDNGTPGCQGSFSTGELVLSDPAGGWSVGGGYVLFFRDAHEDYDYLPATSTTCYGSEYHRMQGRFFKPMLRTPDGSEHELRIFGNYPTYSSIGTKEFLKNYYNYGGLSPTPTFDNPTEMYSIDGSYIKVIVNPSSSSNQWEVYMKDGTRIIQQADGQRIKDVNGNSVFYGWTNDYSFVRDEQTGREIRMDSEIVNNQLATQIRYQKVGGAWENINITFGSTSIQGKIYKADDVDFDGPEGTCTLDKEFQTSIPVIREIILPATEANEQPQKYSFAYNSDTTAQATIQSPRWTCSGQEFPDYTRTVSYGMGELSQITTPSGTVYKYHYSRDGEHTFGDPASEVSRNVITTKEMVHDGTTDAWNYGIDTSPAYVTAGSVVNPDGSSYYEVFYPVSSGDPSLGGTAGLGGLTYRTFQSGRIMIERHWTLLGGSLQAFGSGSFNLISYNPVVDIEYTTLRDANNNRVKMSAKKFQYDYNGNLIQTVEYDWFDSGTVTFGYYDLPTGIPSSATVLRTINNSYYNQAADANASTAYQRRSVGTSSVILGALQQTSVVNTNSVSRFSYDGQSYGTAPTKGNPTQISVWNDTNNTWINSGITYDGYGNVITKTDPKGNTTQIFYEDATHAMPTKIIIDPQNGTGQQITTATYDFSTGLPLTATDINGNVSSNDYTNHLLGAVDPFGRPGTVFSPYVSIDGINQRLTSKNYYEDTARKIRTESDVNAENDAVNKSRESFDQIGRNVLSEKNENGANVYTISSETIYKTPERVVMTSNPHRSGSSTTDGWTRATSDIFGRTIEVETFAGASQPPVTGTNTNSTGKVISAYDQNVTTITDQAGKQRRSIINAIGQLTAVHEPNNAGQLGAVNTPNQPTLYTYDESDNLTQVQQNGLNTEQCGMNNTNCSQTRTFVYDSLSRLKSATNPEAGLIQYEYDNNGNLTVKTDARGVQTTYAYDALNRIISRSYTNEPIGQLTTPSVGYTYDNLPNAKGRLTKVTTTGSGANSFTSVTDYQAFDVLGRVTQSQQTVDGISYGITPQLYKYNLAGALIEQTYPSGRVVKNVLDTDGDLAMVQSKKNVNTGFWSYAKAFTYTAAGAITSLQLGNGKWESTQFNSRLQPTQIALGVTQNATNLLKLNFDYGTMQNNGNVLSQTIFVPSETRNNQTNAAFSATQNYNYDALNRLKDAAETIAGSQTWKQTFTYDRYGNRNFDEGGTSGNYLTTTLTRNCATSTYNPNGICDKKKTNPNFAASNRIVQDQDNDLQNDYQFDTAGNTIRDASNKKFTYDGENKQTKVETVDSNGNVTGTLGTYFYDGDGKRVKKMSATETTIFIYDAGGKLVAEYANQTATTPQVSYLTSDHLGSPRINTDQNGAVTARHDYQPFGEEVQRASYGDDDVRKKFAAYERDDETDLDFAQARYYSRQNGRFITVDPLMASAVVTVTQSWNRYSYALNNPLRYIDPTGEAFEDLTEEQLRVFQSYVNKQNKGREKPLTAKEVYNGLTQDQQTTFESVTHALENTQLTDNKGRPIKDKDGNQLNALNLVAGITQISGEIKGEKEGRKQFRLLVDLKDGAIDKIANSKEFNDGSFFGLAGNGHIFKNGQVISATGLRQKGNEPKLQVSYLKKNKLEADIDVDYRGLGEGHTEPYNSDIRAIGPEKNNGKPISNLERHNQRYGKENPLRNIPTN